MKPYQINGYDEEVVLSMRRKMCTWGRNWQITTKLPPRCQKLHQGNPTRSMDMTKRLFWVCAEQCTREPIIGRSPQNYRRDVRSYVNETLRGHWLGRRVVLSMRRTICTWDRNWQFTRTQPPGRQKLPQWNPTRSLVRTKSSVVYAQKNMHVRQELAVHQNTTAGTSEATSKKPNDEIGYDEE
jgi:hypothetical protein